MYAAYDDGGSCPVSRVWGHHRIDAVACPKCGQPQAAKRYATKAIAVLGMVAMAIFVLYQTGILASSGPGPLVQCRTVGSLADGIECTVEHGGGGGTLEVTWSVELTCSNGVKGVGAGSARVDRGGRVVSTVSYKSFAGSIADCPRVSGMRVFNIAAK
jgi:hypothetical protein